jgi:hypothetical protein
MHLLPLQRRQLLLAISQVVLIAALPACSGEGAADSAAAPQSPASLLAEVAFDLFPFPELPPALYAEVGQRLSTADTAAIAEGLVHLRSAAGATAWHDVAEVTRLAALSALAGTPFFAAARAATLEVLFRAPATFALLGYGGSAIEQGGYVNRGFADIDWLPAAP